MLKGRDMTNLIEELLWVLRTHSYELNDVQAVVIEREYFNDDMEYDSGYGNQYIYGTIWMKDGTWFDRDEYDGSEWWEYRKRPDIPEDLKV